MPYYDAGDYAGRSTSRYYTAGDYYMAGGFFSKLGGALGGLAKVALPAVGTMFGGPLGGAAGLGLSSLLGGGKATGSSLPASNILQPSGRSSGIPFENPFSYFGKGALRPALKSTTPTGQFMLEGGPVPGSGRTPGRSVLPGYTVGADGSIRRRGRRMNVLNPKALRRGMRRVQGFARFAKKTISFTQRVKMKKRRRS